MDKVTRIGMDTSKRVFQLHGVGESERVVLKRKVRRQDVFAFFAELPATKIGIEACGAAHYWARELMKLGHEVVLVPPQYAKAYVKRGKNDAADAAAICEAMSRPSMSFVMVKTAEQQADLMLAGVRETLIKTRTRIANAIRGYAAEFGHVAPEGLGHLAELRKRVAEDKTLPKVMREMITLLGQDFDHADRQCAKVEAKLMAWHKSNAASRRLTKIPGVGPIGASLMVMKTPNPKAFKSARHFAAWMGLTPKDHSTAGKMRMGAITRAGDEMLRSTLVAGATSITKLIKHRPERVSPWLRALDQRKPRKVTAVALANKNARIAWKMMVTGEVYDAQRSRMGETLAVA